MNGTALGTDLKPSGGTLTLALSSNTTVTIQSERNVFNLSFDSNGGSLVQPMEVAFGAEATIPADPTRADARFLGWYYDGKVYLAGSKFTMPNHDVTMTAQWEPAKELTIQVNGNSNETFLFRITGTNEPVNMVVSVRGGSYVTISGLYHDTYTVTELNDWSWTRGEVGYKTVEMRIEDNVTQYEVSFEMPSISTCWLFGENHS